jgi:hypothetical protein
MVMPKGVHDGRKKGSDSPFWRGGPRTYAERKAESNRAFKMKTRYGLTRDQLIDLQEHQDDHCLVCLSPLYGEFVVDHNHATGEVRGLLHCGCNTALGYVESGLAKKAERFLSASS